MYINLHTYANNLRSAIYRISITRFLLVLYTPFMGAVARLTLGASWIAFLMWMNNGFFTAVLEWFDGDK